MCDRFNMLGQQRRLLQSEVLAAGMQVFKGSQMRVRHTISTERASDGEGALYRMARRTAALLSVGLLLLATQGALTKTGEYSRKCQA